MGECSLDLVVRISESSGHSSDLRIGDLLLETEVSELKQRILVCYNWRSPTVDPLIGIYVVLVG